MPERQTYMLCEATSATGLIRARAYVTVCRSRRLTALRLRYEVSELNLRGACYLSVPKQLPALRVSFGN